MLRDRDRLHASTNGGVSDDKEGGRPGSRWREWIAGALLTTALCALLFFLFKARPLPGDVWSDQGLARLSAFTALYMCFAVPVSILRPAVMPLVLLLFAAALATAAVGLRACIAVGFVLASAEAVGAKLLKRTGESSLEQHVSNVLMGIAVYASVMSITINARVNFVWTYALILVAPLLFDIRRLATGWRVVVDARRLLRNAQIWARALYPAKFSTWRQRVAFGLLGYVLAFHFLIVLRPEIAAEGLVTHVTIPATVALKHWLPLASSPVVPMASDHAYSILYLLGGEAAARLFNFALLLTIALLLYCALRRWLATAMALSFVACFAATPLVGLVTGSLFGENLQAALLLAALMALWRFGETGQRPDLYLAAVLCGTAVAANFGSIWFVACLLPFAVWHARPHLKPHLNDDDADGVRWAILLLMVFAAPVFIVASIKTGSVALDYPNETLPTPLLERRVSTTSLLGFLPYPVLAIVAIVASAAFRQARIVGPAVVGIVGAFFVLRTAPSTRYVYAALPLLFLPAAACIAWLLQRRRAGDAFVGCLAACTLLSVYLFPYGSPFDRDFDVSFSEEARREHTARAPPPSAAAFDDPVSDSPSGNESRKQASDRLWISPARVPICKTTTMGRTRVFWTTREPIDIRVDAADGSVMATAGADGYADTGPWVAKGTSFYLQPAGRPGSDHTLARVEVTDTVDGPCE